MVLVQIIFAGVNVMYKLAADDGMSLRLIVVYRFMFATVIMVPLAIIFERMEKLAIRTNAGKAKVCGTLIGIGGAMAKMSVGFPYLYSSTALMCLMGSIQGALYAVCTVRDWNQWKLGWNVRLLAVAFVGIMGSALLVFLVSWAVRLKGPLYAAIFNPLGLVFVAIVGSLLLDEKLHLG
ncbi:hypothetical protein Goklo_003197, partial [Gossypium klotzschianum]|nr:hypothetical protein [Gossypium klotzschianum]